MIAHFIECLDCFFIELSLEPRSHQWIACVRITAVLLSSAPACRCPSTAQHSTAASLVAAARLTLLCQSNHAAPWVSWACPTSAQVFHHPYCGFMVQSTPECAAQCRKHRVEKADGQWHYSHICPYRSPIRLHRSNHDAVRVGMMLAERKKHLKTRFNSEKRFCKCIQAEYANERRNYRLLSVLSAIAGTSGRWA